MYYNVMLDLNVLVLVFITIAAVLNFTLRFNRTNIHYILCSMYVFIIVIIIIIIIIMYLLLSLLLLYLFIYLFYYC